MSSGTIKGIDTLYILLHEDGLEVEDRRTTATDILRELATQRQDIPKLLEVIQDQFTGHVTRIMIGLVEES